METVKFVEISKIYCFKSNIVFESVKAIAMYVVNSEASASEFLENLVAMFPRYLSRNGYMDVTMEMLLSNGGISHPKKKCLHAESKC